jgi:uncharacterized SAM-binding protein YcdF (DUF218 family)
MSIFILFIPLFLAAIALFFKKIRLGLALVLTSLIWLLVVGCGFLPNVLATNFQKNDFLLKPSWKKNNLIIVLGAGTARSPFGEIRTPMFGYPRIYEAARLYFNCKEQKKICHVIVSGGDPAHNGISEAETMAKDLNQIGVSSSDIILERKSNNTFQNAQYVNEIIKTQNFDSFVLVTSGMHMRRSLLYFSHFGLHPQAAPADFLTPFHSIVPLSINFIICDFLFHEYAGIILYKFYH